MIDFARTREALHLYDETRQRRELLWRMADNDVDLGRAEAADVSAAGLVRDSFYADTKEFNSKEHCALVCPDDEWLRRVVHQKSPEEFIVCGSCHKGGNKLSDVYCWHCLEKLEVKGAT